MLKSIELKQDIDALKAEIDKMIADKVEVPEEKQNEFNAMMDEYESIKAEEKAKEAKPMELTKKSFNDALKSFLVTKDSAKLVELYNAATGNNGAVVADGGALVPEELLDVVENGEEVLDLRQYVSVVQVSSRSGKIPVIDYSQKLELVDFDENNEIAETKALFKQLAYTLKSKGAIIPVSNELIRDAASDILAIISKLFGIVYRHDVNKKILDVAVAGAGQTVNGYTATKAGVDLIKTAVNTLPVDAKANAKIVMNTTTFAALANVSDKQDRYLLARDANGNTIPQIEGKEIIVVDDKDMASGIVVANLKTIYHIENPGLEVASSAEAGFTINGVKMRAVCRYTDAATYDAAVKVITA